MDKIEILRVKIVNKINQIEELQGSLIETLGELLFEINVQKQKDQKILQNISEMAKQIGGASDYHF